MIFDIAIIYGKALQQLRALCAMSVGDQFRILFGKVYPFAIVVLFAALSIIYSGERRRFRELRDAGVSTKAIIEWTESGWGATAGYSYVAANRRYSGTFRGRAQLNDSIWILYAAGDPSASCVCDPADELRKARLAPLAISIWAGAFVPLTIFLYGRLLLAPPPRE